MAVARLTEPVPEVAVIVPPPHVPVSPLGEATTKTGRQTVCKGDSAQAGGRVGIRDAER